MAVTVPKDAIRVTIADGCPPSVAGHADDSSTAVQWVANPDGTGLSDAFVPALPSEALVCRYAAVDTVTTLPDGRQLDGGALYSATKLDRGAADDLAATLNDIDHWDFVAGCLTAIYTALYTAIMFAIDSRVDVDVWLKDWVGCPEVSNGIRTSGLLVNGHGASFLAYLDSVAAPAPQQT
jgi:hypothetical protein